MIRKGYEVSWTKELEARDFCEKDMDRAWTPWHTVSEFSLQIWKFTACKAEDVAVDMLQLNWKRQRPCIAVQTSRGINQPELGWSIWMDARTAE